jgi:hypothetical protein
VKIYDAVPLIPSDVAVLVPGAGVLPDGTLYERGLHRIGLVENVLNTGAHIPALFLSGGKATDTVPSEADAMYAHMQHVVPGVLQPGKLFLEAGSVNTLQNLVNCMPFIEAVGPDCLALGTDKSHMWRITALARKVLPRSVDILPVTNTYAPTQYELKRERAAQAVTRALLLGVPDSAGPAAIEKRQKQYEAAKQKIRPSR